MYFKSQHVVNIIAIYFQIYIEMPKRFVHIPQIAKKKMLNVLSMASKKIK